MTKKLSRLPLILLALSAALPFGLNRAFENKPVSPWTSAVYAQVIEEVDPFYLRLFEEGKYEYQRGNFQDAIEDFGIAFIGFLDTPSKLLECYVYLTVLHYDLKDIERSKYYYGEIKKLKLSSHLASVQGPPVLLSKYKSLDSFYTGQELQARIAAGMETSAPDVKSPAGAGLDRATLEAEIRQLKTVLQKNKEDLASYLRLSTLYQELKNWREARRTLQSLLAVSPENGQAYFELGRVALQEKKNEEAANFLRKAASFNPDNHDIFYELGKLQYQQGRYLEAKQSFSKVMALSPSYKDTSDYLNVLTEYESRKSAEVKAVLDQARSVEDPKEKIKLYKKALGMNPGHDETAYELSLALLAAGRGKEAVRELEPLVQRRPEEMRFIVALASAYVTAKSYDQAVALLEQAEAAFGEKTELNYLQGRALMGKRKYQEAAEEFNKILLVYPDYRDTAQLMTYCLARIK